MNNSYTSQLGEHFEEGPWPSVISSEQYSLAGFDVFSKPQVGLHGKELTITWHMQHTMVIQTRATCMCTPSTQDPGAILVVPPFQPG